MCPLVCSTGAALRTSESNATASPEPEEVVPLPGAIAAKGCARTHTPLEPPSCRLTNVRTQLATALNSGPRAPPRTTSSRTRLEGTQTAAQLPKCPPRNPARGMSRTSQRPTTTVTMRGPEAARRRSTRSAAVPCWAVAGRPSLVTPHAAGRAAKAGRRVNGARDQGRTHVSVFLKCYTTFLRLLPRRR